MKLCVALCFALAVAAVASRPLSKQLAGPAEEMEMMRMPHPSLTADIDNSVYVDVKFRAGKFVTPVVVDSKTQFTITVVSSDRVFASLKDPNGKAMTMVAVPGVLELGDGAAANLPETTYRFLNPVPGTYTLTLTTLSHHATVAELIVFNESPVALKSHVASFETLRGNTIGLVAHVDGPGAVSRMQMRVTSPSGDVQMHEMHDDGVHGDGLAMDGVYSASVTAEEIGFYYLSAVASGVSDGVAFERMTEHLVPVDHDQVDLIGDSVGMQARDNGRLVLQLPVESSVHEDRRVRVYAELFVQDTPVAWLSSIQEVRDASLALEFDLRWLGVAGVSGLSDWQLRNVVVQYANNYIPVATAAVMNIATDEHLVKEALFAARVNLRDATITDEMRQGIKPAALSNVEDNGAPTLMMVHGYCTDVNPWKKNQDKFDAIALFLDSKKSRPTDDFAVLVSDYAESLNMNKYSVVGHSQGGKVGAHLLNYYWTGMDALTMENGGAKIQSVGTPYQGCTAAGSMAKMGKIFGYGCGENYDLTREGATVWGSSISKATRQNVHYYTTTYKLNKSGGDWCSLAANAVLQWPNDGCAEIKFSSFEYANDHGNSEKECHSTGLGYPAQYYSESRNAEFNKNAARK